MKMKTAHEIGRALKEPQLNKTYGARVEGLKVVRGRLVYVWIIFARKPRGKKA